MFGLLELMTTRVNDQIAEYAAAQSDIARRLWGNWLDPFKACQLVRIDSDRLTHGRRTIREASRHR